MIKQGDTLPLLEAQILKADGSALVLTGASVSFRMWRLNSRPAGSYFVDAAATIVDAATGRVRYSWQTGDTATVGQYAAEFVVVFPDLRQQTVPTEGYLAVSVVDSGVPG